MQLGYAPQRAVYAACLLTACASAPGDALAQSQDASKLAEQLSNPVA
jgi:hypothetical protein